MPQYDLRKAAQYSGIAWPNWLQLSEIQRAEAVAFFRIDHLLELHYKLEAIKDMKHSG